MPPLERDSWTRGTKLFHWRIDVSWNSSNKKCLYRLPILSNIKAAGSSIIILLINLLKSEINSTPFIFFWFSTSLTNWLTSEYEVKCFNISLMYINRLDKLTIWTVLSLRKGRISINFCLKSEVAFGPIHLSSSNQVVQDSIFLRITAFLLRIIAYILGNLL